MHWPTPPIGDIRPSQRPDRISLEAATEQIYTHGVMLHDQDYFVHWTTVLVRHVKKMTVLCTLDHLLSARPSVYQSCSRLCAIVVIQLVIKL